MRQRSWIGIALALVSTAAHAADIKVYEDKYGVPSIVAGNLKEAMFAEGYIQGKDHAVRMATNYKIARGRYSEAVGKGSLMQDGFVRGLGLEAKAEELVPQLSGEAKVTVEAYLAGANKAISEQKGTLPNWIEPFTAVDVLSLAQFVNGAFPLLDLSEKISPGAGSNQFALAPSKTSTHHPIVSIDPHLGWDGQDGGIVWQEFAIYTSEIHFRGVAIPGLPTGVLGHNDKVAWSMTNNNPSLYTIYTVKTNPANKAQYSYHGKWENYETRTVPMSYRDGDQLKTTNSTVRMTKWGPMVPFSNRSAKFSLPNPIDTIEQGLAMIRSQSVDDVRNALKHRGLSMWNFVFADVKGNISYQYNAHVPQRDASFDWSKPVPGDDPKTEWGPLWDLDQLPRIQNPLSGILVNCNSNPKFTPTDDEMNQDWPGYVTSYGPTTRWENLSALLKANKKISPEKAMEIATDCAVPYAGPTVDRLSTLVSTGNAIDVLKKWDKKSTVDSMGCVLYTYWLRENKGNPGLSSMAAKGEGWSDAQNQIAKDSLESAAKKMIAEQGELTTRWGAVQYMQRGKVKSPVQGFGYVAPGSTIAAVSPASAGAATLKEGRSHATFGSSMRMIISLDPKGVQSWSVLPYGNSNVPTSPHYSDQMELYSVGKYKPTYFGEVSAKKHSVRNYTLTY